MLLHVHTLKSISPIAFGKMSTWIYNLIALQTTTESLLLKKLSDGSPLTTSSPCFLRQKKLYSPLPVMSVKKGAQRVGTGHASSSTSFPSLSLTLHLSLTSNLVWFLSGRFDAIDEEIVKAIMSRVPFLHRLACATSTCKSCRSLKDILSLWSELIVKGHSGAFTGYKLSSQKFLMPGVVMYVRNKNGLLWVHTEM